MALAGTPLPRELVSSASLRNAMIVLQAIGGSTTLSFTWPQSRAALACTFDLDAFDN